MSGEPAYRSLVLDVDSTLCGVEGIDWLAGRRGPAVAAQVAALTERAMNGEITLDAVYGERLALIRPSRAEVAALAEVYRARVAEGAPEAIAAMQAAGVRVVLVSGGLLPAIAPLARSLAVELRAVDIRFDQAGTYSGFERESPLTTQRGKLDVVQSLRLEPRVAAVGDGASDLAMRGAVDTFVAFTGFVTRDPVVAAADSVAADFGRLRRLVLP